MSSELIALMGTAAGLGFIHTLIGPDHYLPFIVISKARNWSRGKTAMITFLCGLGHVLSSVVLGMIGIAAGISLEWLVSTESHRGDIAAWLLTVFGLLYCIWGLRQAWLNKPHTHRHAHLAGSEHEHEHTHGGKHVHPHNQGTEGKVNLTPWILFTIFVFGPCEPLIPLLMFPAAAENFWSVAAVAAVFSVVTIGMMMSIVMAATFGLTFMRFQRIEKFSHAIAGGLILMCGVAIHLGL